MIKAVSAALLALVLGTFAVGPDKSFAQGAGGGGTSDPAQVKPGAYVLDADHGKVTWSVSHLGFSTYVGHITDLAGQLTLDPQQPTRSTLQVTIKTASVTSLHPELDKHLKSGDFFNVEKFPQAAFASKTIELAGANRARINGELTLLGVTKPVTIEAVFNRAGIYPVDKQYRVGFDGTATIRRSDFGMKYLVPAVSDEVTLRLEAEFNPAP